MSLRYRKKSGFGLLVVRVVIFLWVAGFLSGFLKEFGAGVFPSKYRHTEYRETREILASIKPYERDLYPDSFIPASQRWEYGRASWESLWHVSRKELKAAAVELDHFLQNIPVAVSPDISREDYSTAFFSALYRTSAEKSRPRLNNIVYALNWFRLENELTDREFIELVIRFIQEIPYEIPDDRRYGFASPQEVLTDNRGDCDSKSVLAAVLLRRFGIDTVILLSPFYQHAMLGVGYPSMGDYREYRSRPYYFVELTRPGWNMGQLPKEVGDPRKWRVIPLE